MKPKILVSACLLGQPVRYNGKAKQSATEQLTLWQQQGQLVVVCPEVAAGLPTPRPPAEIMDAETGESVLQNKGRIRDIHSVDVTSQFIHGAQFALKLALQHQCRFALLTDKSPSCGSRLIYNGTFSGALHTGRGVTAELLHQHGIQVFAEDDIHLLADALLRLSPQDSEY